MGTSSTTINAVVDALITDLQTATTLGLGASPKVYERDTEPAQVEREDLPCAFVLPFADEGCEITMNIPAFPATWSFGITAVAYYKGTGDTPTNLQTDLRTIRNYSLEFVDYYRSRTNSAPLCGAKLNRAMITNIRLEQGYWIAGGGNVYHFWMAKMTLTAEL